MKCDMGATTTQKARIHGQIGRDFCSLKKRGHKKPPALLQTVFIFDDTLKGFF